MCDSKNIWLLRALINIWDNTFNFSNGTKIHKSKTDHERVDELLEKHPSEGPSNAQYTSSFSARVLIEAIDNWI